MCETIINIPCDDFKILEILVSPRVKFHFSVSRSDIFDWSHDWSTIQFSQFTGQISVKPMLPIPHPNYIFQMLAFVQLQKKMTWKLWQQEEEEERSYYKYYQLFLPVAKLAG